MKDNRDAIIEEIELNIEEIEEVITPGYGIGG